MCALEAKVPLSCSLSLSPSPRTEPYTLCLPWTLPHCPPSWLKTKGKRKARERERGEQQKNKQQHTSCERGCPTLYSMATSFSASADYTAAGDAFDPCSRRTPPLSAPLPADYAPLTMPAMNAIAALLLAAAACAVAEEREWWTIESSVKGHQENQTPPGR